jgi:LysM repeat protein
MIKLLVIAGLSFFNPRPDSIGIETINGKTFIIHQVGEKETLYGLSRRYGVTIDQILEANPSADAGLSIGQIIRVPYIPKPKQAAGDIRHKVAEKETLFSIAKQYGVQVEDIKRWNNLTDNALHVGQILVLRQGNTVAAAPVVPQPSTPEMKTQRTVHTVAAKETLFSIARQYGITVQQVKEWNSLTTEELKIGQLLFVSQPMYTPATTVQLPVETPASTQKPTVTEPQPDTQVITISESVRDKDEIRENGIAEVIAGTEGNRKYLALHRTAPVGTILKVRNEMNNREVFVRVVGVLPDTGLTDKVLIRVSKSAYERLGAIDPRFRVEVTYYK